MSQFLTFETKLLDTEFFMDLHPETRLVVVELQAELGEQLRITGVGRSDADSERIYSSIAARLMATDPKELGPIERAQREQLLDLSPVGVQQWCRLRPSWHKPFCAVDIGTAQMSSESFDRARLWLLRRCSKPDWETVLEKHGTGPHIHLARRDFDWLADFPGSLRRSLGRRGQTKNPPVLK
jgi:hypothetical protein